MAQGWAADRIVNDTQSTCASRPPRRRTRQDKVECLYCILYDTVLYADRARAFAWSRANAASEFREVVGGHEALESIIPRALAHQVIPFLSSDLCPPLWPPLVEALSRSKTSG